MVGRVYPDLLLDVAGKGLRYDLYFSHIYIYVNMHTGPGFKDDNHLLL